MFDEAGFDIVSVLEYFSKRIMLHQLILHIGSEEALEEFALLSDEVAGACDHLAKPAVHFVLVLTLRHPVELTHLLYKLMHGEHLGRQRFTVFVNVFGALDHFTVENLVGIDEVGHFGAEYAVV